MLEESEALARILAAVSAPGRERVPLADALNRHVLTDLLATLPLPGFDNSVMDGYALNAADCAPSFHGPGHPLAIAGHQPAGPDRGLEVVPGHCVRIFTGAPLPRNTAAVVMQEDTVLSADKSRITLTEPVTPGEFVRFAGSDLTPGQRILTAGQHLTPARIALLASQGLTAIECGALPRAAVLTTGDELLPAGQPLPRPGQLYNTNGPMLQALLTGAGARATAAHSADHLPSLINLVQNLLGDSDILVLAGGVSVGEHDLVKPALESLGIPLHFWRIRLKPGKPFLFSTHQGKLIFGLPGNPVSAFVTAVLFLLPAVRRLAGAAPDACPPRTTPATLLSEVRNTGDRPHFIRGHYRSHDATFMPAGLQQSHALHALAGSNALLRLPADSSAAAGTVHSVVLCHEC